ncbi:MAG: dUTP diphosphatase [Treponema sp.]|jgi:dUTP pyrophosphatase|nr:dUTP diphosphatase [Treponema sp.]
MQSPVLKIRRLPGAALPAYESAGASGLDVRAFLETDLVLAPGERAFVPTGLFIETPEGCEAQMRPRSGLAAKQGLTVLNTPGTIDADYRGELKVILINLGQEAARIRNGDRIAQVVVCPVTRVQVEETSALSETARGSGGFGSTGNR